MKCDFKSIWTTFLLVLCVAIALLLGILMPLDASAEENMYVAVNVGSTLNVRTSADVDGAVTGSLSRGDLVTVLDTESGWSHIHHHELTGWVCSDYLSADYPPVPLGGAYTVNASPFLNVRDNPKGALVCKLSAGATVYVFDRCIDEDGAEWSQLEQGWVMSRYLTEVDDDE